eukprot:jgi/Chlat1/1957/Chrsp157S02266
MMSAMPELSSSSLTAALSPSPTDALAGCEPLDDNGKDERNVAPQHALLNSWQRLFAEPQLPQTVIVAAAAGASAVAAAAAWWLFAGGSKRSQAAAATQPDTRKQELTVAAREAASQAVALTTSTHATECERITLLLDNHSRQLTDLTSAVRDLANAVSAQHNTPLNVKENGDAGCKESGITRQELREELVGFAKDLVEFAMQKDAARPSSLRDGTTSNKHYEDDDARYSLAHTTVRSWPARIVTKPIGKLMDTWPISYFSSMLRLAEHWNASYDS